MSAQMVRRVLQPVKRAAKFVLQAEFREAEKKERKAFSEFKLQTDALWCDHPTLPPTNKTILCLAGGKGTLKLELAYMKALQLAGFKPVVLSSPDVWLARYYRLWGIDCIFWDDYLPTRVDEHAIQQLKTFEDVLAFKFEGTLVGKYVASWVMRQLRVGRFDPADDVVWDRLVAGLQEGMRYAVAAVHILDDVSPDAALFLERGYSPWGQLFDLCIAREIDTLQWTAAHKDNTLIFKRFNQKNRNRHHSTLSENSWDYIQRMPWGDAQKKQIQAELLGCYESGQWFSEVGTQFDKSISDRLALQSQLGLDPNKKTAILFAHMFWDASFFYGEDLFADYQDWFVQAIQAASKNTNLNWIVKLHPANAVKDMRDGYVGEASEIVAIRNHIGTLPSHVKLLDSNTDINTFSLFSLMDYCLTVRGTIGIEAGIFGIPVLTAGTGRYDHFGFTIDSESTEEYLHKLAHLHEIELPTEKQCELAQRHAFGIFMMRPFLMRTVTLAFEQDAVATPRSVFHVQTIRELFEATDIQAFVNWVCASDQEDYLADITL